jgi:hypothetical protein
VTQADRRGRDGGGPIFPALFIGAAGGMALSHLPGLPLVAGLAMGMGAMSAVMLTLPLTSVLVASLLLGSDAAAAMPLVIVAVAVAYVATARLAPRPPAAAPAPAAAAPGTPAPPRQARRHLPARSPDQAGTDPGRPT